MNFKNYFEVIPLLIRAQEMALSFCGGHSEHFKTNAEFREALRESIALLKHGDTSQLRRIYEWFMPTSSWFNMIGPDGYHIGDQIREKLTEILVTKSYSRG